MDIEKEIREEFAKTQKFRWLRESIAKEGVEQIADWWITRLHTLLERQVEGIRAEVEDIIKENLGDLLDSGVYSKFPEKDKLLIALNRISHLDCLQPTLKDNPQKE